MSRGGRRGIASDGRAQSHLAIAAKVGMFLGQPALTLVTNVDAEGTAVSDGNQTVKQGDVIELTLRGERRTAEAMLVTDDGLVLLDLFDGDRPGWGYLSLLEDVAVYRPDEALAAA
jgi:hypothetical protein